HGDRHILISVNSGGGGGTRGVVAIDPITGAIDWQYLTGPMVINPTIIDIDGDGTPEIVFGSYAPQNNVILNGTRDDSSYIFILDDLGNERWRKTIGPFWTGAFPIIGDMTGDGKKELVVYRWGTNSKFTDYDELIRLDIRDGAEINRKKVGNPFTAMVYPLINLCHDFDGDGIEEFVIGSTDGFVRMYHGDLSVMYSSEPYRRAITVHGIGDLDGDGLLELACVTADKRLVILNHQLKQLLIEPLPTNFDYLALIKLPHKHQILLAGQSIDKPNDFQLLDFHAVGLVGAVQKQGRNFLLLILSLAALVAALLILRNLLYGKRAFQLLLQILEQTQSLDSALILDRRRKISRLGKNWVNLLEIFPHQAEGKYWQEIFGNSRLQPLSDALEKMLAENLSDHECLCPIGAANHVPVRLKAFYISWINAHCFLFFDLREQEHIRQVKHWAQVAQKLAHGIKNPLTTVKLNAEELLHKIRSKKPINGKEVEEYITPIISQVTKLKKMSDGFMHFVEFEQPDLKPADLNREIKELILQWQPEKTIKIQIAWDLEENLPPAMIDQKQFEYAVK
ncbi:MAG TPA: hypothetical protein VGD14_08315, partial [bacterium]